MEVTFARLLLDWIEEHYPSKFVMKENSAWMPFWDTNIMLAMNDVPTNGSPWLGRVGDTAFYPWILEQGEPETLYAADPEFFEKFDWWINNRIFNQSLV